MHVLESLTVHFPRRTWALLAAVILVGSAGSAGPTAALQSSPSWTELRGRVRCVESAASLDDPRNATEAGALDPCNVPGASFVFEPDTGPNLRLLTADPIAGMFIDPRVRARYLALRGWKRPGGSFELLSVFSIFDGKRHRIHYRCEVCDITATAPGPCWCCGAPFELREEPTDEEN